VALGLKSPLLLYKTAGSGSAVFPQPLCLLPQIEGRFCSQEFLRFKPFVVMVATSSAFGTVLIRTVPSFPSSMETG
jgi:hypothetical protein